MKLPGRGWALLVGAATLTACSVAPVPSPTSRPTAQPSTTPKLKTSQPASVNSGATLADLLDRLIIAPEHLDGYDRDLFPVWDDVDGNGCNTRYEVLLDEAVEAPTVSGSCDLAGGLWVSPYDGVELHDASEVQIDHLVALAEAWYSGADQWTTERRQRFANDLGTPWELNAVSGPVNEAKAASDPAEWLPPEPTAICPYIEAWVATKVRWALAIDPKEATALRRLVVGCPSRHVDVPPAG